MPIAQHPGIAFSPRRRSTSNSRLMMYKAAWAHDQFGGGAVAGEAMAKLASADAGLAALDTAIQTHGGNGSGVGVRARRPLGTRRAPMSPIMPRMILNFVSQQSLGLPKS